MVDVQVTLKQYKTLQRVVILRETQNRGEIQTNKLLGRC